MVTAAAAIVQAVHKKRKGAPLTPAKLREVLRATGTPQPSNDAKKIGPLPNVKAATAHEEVLRSQSNPSRLYFWNE